jgi:hypothetical protein
MCRGCANGLRRVCVNGEWENESVKACCGVLLPEPLEPSFFFVGSSFFPAGERP